LYHCDKLINRKLYISGWLGGAREDCCPQRFKWVLEYKDLKLPSGCSQKTRVAGWCKGELLFLDIQVGACVTGSWCFHLVGVGTYRELLLPSRGC
jgi:hypothetical protein